jgi:hypothetical protein
VRSIGIIGLNRRRVWNRMHGNGPNLGQLERASLGLHSHKLKLAFYASV